MIRPVFLKCFFFHFHFMKCKMCLSCFAQVTSLVNTMIFTGTQFIRFTVHARSLRNDSLQLLNTPIISMETLSALEDRNGLACIECGHEVRLLIPMRTHPASLAQQQQQQSEEGTFSTASAAQLLSYYSHFSLLEACLRRQRDAWMRFHGREMSSSSSDPEGRMGRRRDEGAMQTLAVFIAWIFVMAAMTYPYAMIIFMTWRQMTVAYNGSGSSNEAATHAAATTDASDNSRSNHWSTNLLMIASAIAAVWRS